MTCDCKKGLRWYHYIIFLVITIITSFIISTLQNESNPHYVYPFIDNGWIGQSNLYDSQYIKYKDNMNPQPEGYLQDEVYIDYEIPSYVRVSSLLKYKNGSLERKSVRCYFDNQKIDCSGGHIW